MVSWNFNGEPFTSDESSNEFTEGDKTFKQFEKKGRAESIDDAGQYQCNITYTSATLGIYDFPGGDLVGDLRNVDLIGVIELSVELKAVVGQEAKMSCAIEGDSQATWIRWFKGDEMIDSTLYSTRYTSKTKVTVSTVTWPSAIKDLSGEYFCEGLYSAGYVKSDLISLTVLDFGVLATPTDKIAQIGSNTAFSCSVSKSTNINVFWYKMPNIVDPLTSEAGVQLIESADDGDVRTSVLSLLDVKVLEKGK